jgi:hypothetical protein
MTSKVSISRLLYEFEEDHNPQTGMNCWDVPNRCEVPIDDVKDRVFETIEDALLYVNGKLGYDIDFIHWGCVRRGWYSEGLDVNMDWQTDLNVNNRFQKASEEEIKLWNDEKYTLYRMTIIVSLVTRNINPIKES